MNSGDPEVISKTIDELVALEALGWQPGNVDRLRVDGVAVHRVTASRRDRRISYVRPGGAPEVDGSIYRAGQTLGFDRTQTTCTSASSCGSPRTEASWV